MRNINNLVDQLFTPKWSCEISKVCLSLISPIQVNDDVFEDHNPAIGDYRFCSGVTKTVIRNNDQGIIEMLLDISKKNVGHEQAVAFGTDRYESVYLSTADLAEIIYKKGDVTLVNWKDAEAIYNEIQLYLQQIVERQITEVHYKPPPEEDIEAFKVCAEVIKDMVIKALDVNEPNKGFKPLIDSLTQHSVNLIKNNKLTLSNHKLPQVRETKKSPYVF